MITRIRELLDIRQLSPTQFADLIGVGRPVISHILSERNKPSLEVVQKIIGAFPDISLPWLLAGTGPMLAADAGAPAANSPTSPAARAALPSDAVVSPVSTIIPAPFVASVAAPTGPSRAAAAFQPNTYPQPPKFRPAVSPSPLTAPRPLPVHAPAPTVIIAEAESVAPTLPPVAPIPEAEAGLVPVAPRQPSLPLPVASATSTDLGPGTSPIIPVAEDPVGSSDVAAPGANPTAALSFLGEPGKAIRRIVIFYRDGSFSDFLPEGY